MKTFIKPLIISTALSAFSLVFAISHASDESLSSLKQQLSVHANVYSLPSFGNNDKLQNFRTSDRINNLNTKKSGFDLLDNFVDSPLLIVPSTAFSDLSLPMSSPQHGFFELFAIFNDKLQSFISYFKSTEVPPVIEHTEDSSAITTSSCDK